MESFIALTPILRNGKKFRIGDVFDDRKDEVLDLLESGAIALNDSVGASLLIKAIAREQLFSKRVFSTQQDGTLTMRSAKELYRNLIAAESIDPEEFEQAIALIVESDPENKWQIFD